MGWVRIRVRVRVRVRPPAQAMGTMRGVGDTANLLIQAMRTIS